MPTMPLVSVAEDQSLHRYPSDTGPGGHARWHVALLAGRQEVAPLHGHLDLLELHGPARDRGCQDSARTLPSTRSAISAAALPPASALSSIPPRWSRVRSA